MCPSWVVSAKYVHLSYKEYILVPHWFLFQQCKMKYVQKIASSFDKIWNLFFLPVFIQCYACKRLELVLTYNEIRIVYELTCLLLRFWYPFRLREAICLGCLYFQNVLKLFDLNYQNRTCFKLLRTSDKNYKVHKIRKMDHPIWHLEQVGLSEKFRLSVKGMK